MAHREIGSSAGLCQLELRRERRSIYADGYNKSARNMANNNEVRMPNGLAELIPGYIANRKADVAALA